MPKIGPVQSVDHLEDSARLTYEGTSGPRSEDPLGLPGVTTDALEVDHKAYETNGELAERIKTAMGALKETDNGVPRFVLGWRMYPNAANPYWEGKTHSCGCGCGCSSHHKKRPKPPHGHGGGGHH
jgi:hypothetical protein